VLLELLDNLGKLVMLEMLVLKERMVVMEQKEHQVFQVVEEIEEQ